MKRLSTGQSMPAQRGAATLVVVMVLFLVMALLAAYANRSLMFEQRISGSYYRASMAQEMAEGGLDWALAMLNGTAIDGACTAVNTGGTRFVDQYLAVSAEDRATKALVTDINVPTVSCARTGAGLVCSCPLPNTRTAQPTTTAGAALVPSVGVTLGTGTDPHYGSVRLTSRGCTDSSIDNCTDIQGLSQTATALSMQIADFALVAAVPSSPSAPLTVKGTLTTAGAGGLGLHNNDPMSAGTLVVSGGAAPTLYDDRMDSVPGTPAAQARIFDDGYLSRLTTSQQDKDRFFQTYMGMVPSRYANHPALRQVSCQGGCGPALQNAYNAGQRMLWVQGHMTLDTNTVIGTVAAPVLVIVNGSAAITGPMQLNGMLMVLGDLDWTNTSGLSSLVNGMVVVQGGMSATGSMDIVYHQSIANILRNRLGSYARVSGGWIDSE